MNKSSELLHLKTLKTKRKPVVTVGICVRNSEATIKEAIDSVLTQDFPRELIEVIFVDDGSTDKTLSIIESYVPIKDMQVKVFHHEWKGLGASRDVVVNCAAGDYIIWVDGDMTLASDFVRRQVAFMEMDSKVGIGKGQYGLCAQESLVGYLENIEFVAAHLRRREKANSLPLGTGGSIYRVKAIRQVGGFDHNIKGPGEDVDAEYRLRKAGWAFEATAPVFYERRRGTWGSLWTEYFWFGKSGSNLFENERQLVDIYRLWPPVMLIVEFSRVIKAYKLTRCKIVFLLPIHYVFKRAAWFLGFAMDFLGKGHGERKLL
jgi:glycosyltransferase involved in cell wall biosynthesis